MEICLSKISARGLRCPDLDIEFNDSVSLLQMPNGTGKTTLLELTKGALVGKHWKSKEIVDFSNPNLDIGEGRFELVLSLKDGKKKSGNVIIRCNFNFHNRTFSYSTNSDDFYRNLKGDDSSKGFVDYHNPPEEIKPFLHIDIVDLFILEGSYVRSLLDDSFNKAEKAIDAFTGINAIKEVKVNVTNHYRKLSRASQGGQAKDKKLLDVMKLYSEVELRLPKIKQMRDKAYEGRQDIQDEYDKLKAQIENDLSNREEFETQKYRRDKASQELNTASDAFFQKLRNPLLIHPKVSIGLQLFNKNLGELNLPTNATEVFFDELCNEPECICGNTMNAQMKKSIKLNSKSYLSDEYNSALNKVKRDIKNYEEDTIEEPLDKALKDYEGASSSFSNEESKLTQLLVLGSGTANSTQLAKVGKVADKAKSIGKLDLRIEGYVKDNGIAVQDSLNLLQSMGIGKFNNIPELERLHEHLSTTTADLQGNLDLKKATDKLQNILQKSIDQTREVINEIIVSKINKSIATLMPGDDSLEVKGIDGNLKLSKSKASQGQNLALAYSFVMALLDRSEHNFPLIVDHPFEGLQQETRDQISTLIPEVCNQYIGFLINSEKWGSLTNPEDLEDRGFRRTDASISYITAFRLTKKALLILDDKNKHLITKTTNGAISYDQSFFDGFKMEGQQG